jgi:hypothetical protein
MEGSRRRPLAILAIHVEKLGNRGFGSARDGNTGSAAEPSRQGLDDATKSACAEASHRRQATLVRRDFELLERLDPELLVNSLRQLGPHARNRGEQCLRAGLASETFEEASSGFDDPAITRARPRLSGKLRKGGDATDSENVGHGSL